jgi:outer membrane protein OmpA-like peptidoglycan-associated protein
MTRWLSALLAVVVLVGLGVFFCPVSNRTTVPPPVAPTPTPAPAPVAQGPTPAPAATPAPISTAADPSADAASRANEKATSELASLNWGGFGARDVIAALNDSVVSFPSGSAEVPVTMAAFLQRAADELKQLPAGYVLEIAGYTDNTGNSAANVALSQRRAEAVRDALIKDGTNPDMFVAKGYGSADPIASNDTPEGRLRNRRIEYHIIKTP